VKDVNPEVIAVQANIARKGKFRTSAPPDEFTTTLKVCEVGNGPVLTSKLSAGAQAAPVAKAPPRRARMSLLIAGVDAIVHLQEAQFRI
jgi:hypothetical protein